VRHRTYASASQTYAGLVSGFFIFFSLLVFALLVEWARVEIWQVNRKPSRRQDEVVSRAFDERRDRQSSPRPVVGASDGLTSRYEVSSPRQGNEAEPQP
jgi:hypothetical protein